MYMFRLLVLFFVVLIGAYVEHQAKKNVRKTRRETRRAENYEISREEEAIAVSMVHLDSPAVINNDTDAARTGSTNKSRLPAKGQLSPDASWDSSRTKETNLVRKNPEPLTHDRPSLLLIRSPGPDISPVPRSTPK